MPGVYREKECPNCQKKHRKRGPYCGQACANSDREVSDNTREAMRKVAEEYNRTPEAIAKQRLFGSGISPEDYAVDIPSFPEVPEGYDTDIWVDKSSDW